MNGRCLITAPSNKAADLIAEKLIDRGEKSIFRFNSHQRVISNVNESLIINYRNFII
jgi:hypothetical protein